MAHCKPFRAGLLLRIGKNAGSEKLPAPHSKESLMKDRGFETLAIHAGHEGFQPDSMSTPIYQSVAYPNADAKEAAAIFTGDEPGFTYGRWDNPTVQVFEKRMAALERTAVRRPSLLAVREA